MRKTEVLKQLNKLMLLSTFSKDKKALSIAKKAISKEYRFKFLANTFLLIITIVIFGSLILLALIVYR